jgi:hypothetical protein
MKKSIDDISIYAYLTPHPLDEFSDIEPDFLEWIPGFINEEDEEGMSPVYRDSNIEIYNKIESLTAQYFKDSVRTMWPLLSEMYINSMQIAIDIFGLISPSSTSLAGYVHGRSTQASGNYTFQLDINLLMTYLKMEEKNEPLSFHDKSVWEHELIHMLDQMSLTEASLYCKSASPHENFKYYLIKFREEGIAELYYLLNGHLKINNIQDALDQFKAVAVAKKSELDFSVPSTDKTKNDLYKGLDFYKLGPWVVLNVLREIEIDWEEDMIANCIEKITNKEVIPIETILMVIKKALIVGPNRFLNHIEKHFDKGFIPLI